MPRPTTEPSIVRGLRFPLKDWRRMQRALKRLNAAENRDMTEADYVRFATRELNDRVLADEPEALAS